MIALFYIGFPKFQEETKANHEKLIARLSQIAPVQVYDFLQPHFQSRADLPCFGDFGSAGGIQVWDFMKAAQALKEPVIVKLRTDLWFCESSLEVVAREVESVLKGHNDVSYLGSNIKTNFDKKDYRYHATEHKKVPDFVVVARREAVLDIERVRERLTEHRDNVANGNKVYKIITPNLDLSYSVNCHIFLMRQALKDPDDWKVGKAFISDYPYGAEAFDYWRTQRPTPTIPKDLSLAIVYTGQPRYTNVTQKNHNELIQKIQEIIPTHVYHFTTDVANQQNNLWRTLSGGSQVWQFINAVKKTNQPIIIKFRPDLWFTPLAMDAVIYELKEIISGYQDAAFMGSNWTDYLGHEHTRIPHTNSPVVQDFVVMARRSELRPYDDVYEDLKFAGSSKLQCGTKVFRSILNPGIEAHNVMCQLWLCRGYYENPTHYQVGLDYVLSYPKQWKMPQALPWMQSQQARYEQT
jgi:hypothetical protein